VGSPTFRRYYGVERTFSGVEYYGAMHNEQSVSQKQIKNMITRDFVFGFLALFTFLAALYVLMPTLPIYLERQGSSVREIGVLVGIYSVSSLISRLLVGKALANHSEKSVMLFGALLFAFTFLALILFRPFWPFFVVRFFQGIAYACLDTAALAFIVNVTPLANRARAIGHFLLGPTLALAIAPSFGMFLINMHSFTVLFLTCAGLSVCAFFFSLRLGGQDTRSSEKAATTESIPFLDFKIIAPATMSFLCNFIWGALIAFLPLHAIQCGIANPGYFFSASGIMLVACRSLGGKVLDRWSKEKLILTFMSVSMIAMVILSFSSSLPMFILLGLLWGSGSAFFFPATMAYALDHAGSSGGTAVGTLRVLTDLGVALGPIVMGIMIPLTGYRAMFLCLALIYLINLAYFQFYLRKKAIITQVV
jgi:predicted MFS family arabinose efflux permease